MFLPFAYDEPVFRPPAEADSLILQATLGCSFNRCAFCAMYKSKTYAPRPVDAVLGEIAQAARVLPHTKRVFLADGDALALPTEHLMALLTALAQAFPDLTRVSAYATPANINGKSDEDLIALKTAKLSLVYLGVESGHPDILRRVTKGATPDAIGRAITKARAADMKVSATVILGLGGQSSWRDHIDATAALLSRHPPTYLATLRLFLEPWQEDQFAEAMGADYRPADDRQILQEMDRLLERTAPPSPVVFRSNHASNVVSLKGIVPRDSARMRAGLQQYLNP